MSRKPEFQCLECGRQFRTVKSAERAVDHGCPQCGGSDIDLISYSDRTVPVTRLDDFDREFLAYIEREMEAEPVHPILNIDEKF